MPSTARPCRHGSPGAPCFPHPLQPHQPHQPTPDHRGSPLPCSAAAVTHTPRNTETLGPLVLFLPGRFLLKPGEFLPRGDKAPLTSSRGAGTSTHPRSSRRSGPPKRARQLCPQRKEPPFQRGRWQRPGVRRQRLNGRCATAMAGCATAAGVCAAALHLRAHGGACAQHPKHCLWGCGIFSPPCTAESKETHTAIIESWRKAPNCVTLSTQSPRPRGRIPAADSQAEQSRALPGAPCAAPGEGQPHTTPQSPRRRAQPFQ